MTIGFTAFVLIVLAHDLLKGTWPPSSFLAVMWLWGVGLNFLIVRFRLPRWLIREIERSLPATEDSARPYQN
jgi:hypothetical protein